ncbi:MAG: hypothetical protein V7K41_01010 [Nostoc sp.]
MIALFVTQVIDSSTYWPKLGIGYWALGTAYSALLSIAHSSD